MNATRERVRKLTIDLYKHESSVPDAQRISVLVKALGGFFYRDNEEVRIPDEKPMSVHEFMKTGYYFGFCHALSEKSSHPELMDSNSDKKRYLKGYLVTSGVVAGYDLCASRVRRTIDDIVRQL